VVEIVHYHHHFNDAKMIVYNSVSTTRNPENQNAIPSTVILPPAYEDQVLPETRGDRIGIVKLLEGKGVKMFYQIVENLPQRQYVALRGEWQPIEDYRPQDSILFLDPVQSMKEFYSYCRIVLVPSLREDAGTIPQEAALAGIPCISSNVMGLPETNGGGIVVKYPYVECWVEEIRKLDDKRYYDSVVAQQREYVKAINWPAKFDSLDESIRKLVGEN
jgi:glycosyltransferase involved in cell wall biosynthesis